MPNLYLAYRVNLAEGSEITHYHLRERFNSGDSRVIETIQQWRELNEHVKKLLLNGRGNEIGELLNQNFDLRCSVMNISPGNIQMVTAARNVGASANFTGSGGAIVGTYTDENMFLRLKTELAKLDIAVIKPIIVPAIENHEDLPNSMAHSLRISDYHH